MKEYNVSKIVGYLEKYKANLSELYDWSVNIDDLIKLEVMEEQSYLRNATAYQKEIQLKELLRRALNDARKVDKKKFEDLCLWVIKKWGGITTARDENTTELINAFIEEQKTDFNRISSLSKVAAFMDPENYIIYDSRIAYALNWIILSEDAIIDKLTGKFFPVPEGRNSRMTAFDINVLIRLTRTEIYTPGQGEEVKRKKFISGREKSVYLDKKDAYTKLNQLIKEISRQLWKEDMDKSKKLYYTEMLLFSIADREIYQDIVKRCRLTIATIS